MLGLQLIATHDIFTVSRRWPSCHCAAIAVAPDGRLSATWYAATREAAPDQAVFVAHAGAPGRIWEPGVPVVDTPRHADGNSVLWYDAEGRLWLYYVTIFGHRWDECKVFARCAPDGYAFGDPVVLRQELGWMLRARPLRLDDGTTLLPMYDERDWSSHVLLAPPGGAWQRYGHVTAPHGLIQPSLVARRDGGLRMYLRSGGIGGAIWCSDSTDGGRAWGYPRPTSLPNPNSGIDAIGLSGGLWAIAYNDSERRRTPLCLALSADEGETWHRAATVASGPGEYSYPMLAEDGEGRLHLVYTHKRLAIRHRVYEVRR